MVEIPEQAVDDAMEALIDRQFIARETVWVSPSRDQVRAMLEGAYPALVAGLQAGAEAAVREMALSQFGDVIKGATYDVMADYLDELETRVCADERKRIRQLAIERGARVPGPCIWPPGRACGTAEGEGGHCHTVPFASLLGEAPRDLEAIGAGPLLDPDCRDGKCGSCVGTPCEHACHTAGRRP